MFQSKLNGKKIRTSHNGGRLMRIRKNMLFSYENSTSKMKSKYVKRSYNYKNLYNKVIKIYFILIKKSYNFRLFILQNCPVKFIIKSFFIIQNYLVKFIIKDYLSYKSTQSNLSLKISDAAK